ncbi:MAG: DUF6622 family protein [Dokdonella sp.]
MIVQILLNTPVWAYAIFVLLLWLGVCQLRARWVSIHRVWLTPMIFIVWGFLGLVLHNTGSAASLSPWLMAASLGVVLGLLRRNTLVIDTERGRVMRPASVMPLLRNLLVFGAHYGLNIAAAFHPGQHSIMQIDMAVSGLFAGFFGGWLIRFMQHYFSASATAGSSDKNRAIAVANVMR